MLWGWFLVGTRGPVPKPKAKLNGHRSRAELEAVDHVLASSKVTIPGMNSRWCPAAKRIWKSFKESEQSKFFQSTDWAWLHWQCDLITKAMEASKPPAQLIAGINAELSNLLVSEGARRRLQLELHRPADEINDAAGNLEVMAEWREKLAGGTR